MQKKTYILLLLCFLCLPVYAITKGDTGFKIAPDINYDFNSINSNYFVSGYLFNNSCHIDGNIIRNSNVTDAVCFYKTTENDSYKRLIADIKMIDVSKKMPKPFEFSISSLNKEIPDTFGNELTEKIFNLENSFFKYDIKCKEHLSRSDFTYDNKSYIDKETTAFSYKVAFQTEKRMWKGAGCDPLSILLLPLAIIYDTSKDHTYVSELVYLENHKKNYEITNINLENTGKTSGFDEFTWEFIKGEKMNTLILKIKMDQNPLGDITNDTISFKVIGQIINETK